jgi:hypothetical protein
LICQAKKGLGWLMCQGSKSLADASHGDDDFDVGHFLLSFSGS